jgi:malic enzyme
MKTLATLAASAVLMIGVGTAGAATHTKSKSATVHTPESIECSKQADAKGLHGAERKKFRAQCKKELKAKATTTPAPATTPAPTPKTETPPAPKT